MLVYDADTHKVFIKADVMMMWVLNILMFTMDPNNVCLLHFRIGRAKAGNPRMHLWPERDHLTSRMLMEMPQRTGACVFLFGHMKPKKRRRDTKMESTLKLVAHAPFKRVIELMKKCL